MLSEAQTLAEVDAEEADGGVPVMALLVAAIAALGGIAVVMLKTDLGAARQKVRRMPGAMMGFMMEHMPDE